MGGGGRRDSLDGLGTGLRHGGSNAGPQKDLAVVQRVKAKKDQRLNHALRIGKISNAARANREKKPRSSVED